MTPAKAVLLALVLAAGFWDLRWRRIPNWLTIPALLAGFALTPPWEAAKGFGLALVVYVPLYALNAAGGGDLKLMAAIGTLAGPDAWLVIFIISSVFGGIAGLALALAKGRLKQTLWNIGHILRSGAALQSPEAVRPELNIAHGDALTLPRGGIAAVATLLYLAAG